MFAKGKRIKNSTGDCLTFLYKSGLAEFMIYHVKLPPKMVWAIRGRTGKYMDIVMTLEYFLQVFGIMDIIIV